MNDPVADDGQFQAAGPNPAPLPKGSIAGLTGLEALRKMIAGDLPPPPAAATMEFWLTEADHGRAVFASRPSAAFLNPLGTVHGGWISAVLDSAMGCAVHSTLAVGEGYTTTSMTVNMVRPLLPESGPLICAGEVVHRGRRMATSEAKLIDSRGKLIAHGSETCMILAG